MADNNWYSLNTKRYHVYTKIALLSVINGLKYLFSTLPILNVSLLISPTLTSHLTFFECTT